MSLKIKIFSFLKKYLPFVIDWGRSVKKAIKKIILQKKKKQNKIVTSLMIETDLRNIGIKEGDNVMLHSSLSKIGYVENGPKTLVDAVLNIIGEKGTLLCPSFAHQTFSKYYLDTDPVFDIVNSPSKAGAVTEYIRKLPGVRRSFHPTDAVCAIGPLADYFTNSHFGQLTPHNENSPFYKLTVKNGKILNIGVPLSTSCTNVHVIEDVIDFNLPVYHKKIYNVKMINENGEQCHMKTKVHDPLFSQKRKPDELIPLFQKEGIMKFGKIGEASANLVQAKGLLEVMIKLYQQNITMYAPFGETQK
ncbi:MAG TPA: AAC(3) family N-acetyltransferase [Bacteroidia bacterium]|jgi:aminoglycoside 3-N-acetyltransferase|nr:AAC(3) family N-acetyltransferase [Bacteroidia bacterium]